MHCLEVIKLMNEPTVKYCKELEPCPWCLSHGEEVAVCRELLGNNLRFRVECSSGHTEGSWQHTREMAVFKWNNRPLEREIRQELRAEIDRNRDIKTEIACTQAATAATYETKIKYKNALTEITKYIEKRTGTHLIDSVNRWEMHEIAANALKEEE